MKDKEKAERYSIEFEHQIVKMANNYAKAISYYDKLTNKLNDSLTEEEKQRINKSKQKLINHIKRMYKFSSKYLD